MAVAKVCGMETEYGIALRGTQQVANPIVASSLLINAYLKDLKKVSWDFEDESPGVDARGFSRDTSQFAEVESSLVNAVLTNGARYYVDHAHPEISTPECTNALDVVRFDRAGEKILTHSIQVANSSFSNGEFLVVYKNNSDRKGNSYGTHENYLMDRKLAFSRLAREIMPHLITRQIYTGAGKVGIEIPVDNVKVDFQLTQRADFFEEPIGLETTLKRPIVNTRDEPHADVEKYRRLHVIVGDANLSEVSNYLKIGVTSLVLSMIEDDYMPNQNLTLLNPVEALKKVSWDITLAQPLELEAGGTITALDLQWELYTSATKYAENSALDSIGGYQVGIEILHKWEEILHGLENDPMELSNQLDWVAKYQLIEGYRQRHGLTWSDDRLAAMDLQYHDMRPEKSLFARLPMKKLVDEESVIDAMTNPPTDTRAYFRGRCLQKWPSAVVAANWDSLVFDLGEDPLRKIPMMEPLKGTAAHVDNLLESCSTPADLLDKLGS